MLCSSHPRFIRGLWLVVGLAAVSTVNAAQVAAGWSHSMHLRDDATLWAWGSNANGQLGDGARSDRSAAVQVLTGVSATSAGRAHTLAIKTDGGLWAWGWNAYGQLGDGTTTDKSSPARLMSGVRALAAGGSSSHAIKTDSSLCAWGLN